MYVNPYFHFWSMQYVFHLCLMLREECSGRSFFFFFFSWRLCTGFPAIGQRSLRSSRQVDESKERLPGTECSHSWGLMRQNQGYFTSPRHDIVISSHSSLIANIIGSSAPELASGQPQNPKSSPVDSCCEISEPQKNDQTCGFCTLRPSFWATIVYYIFIYIYV